VVLAAVTSGCIIVDHDTDRTASLSFYWTCDGARCLDRGATSLVVEIWDPDPAATQPEATQSFPRDAVGATLEGFDTGLWTFRVMALGPTNRVLYEGTGEVRALAGDNRIDLTLAYVP